jgi:hypothetical protein
MAEDTTAWEFYVCCHTDEKSVWTRWRWRRIQNGQRIEPQADFATLRACKADAALHGFDPGSSACAVDWRDAILEPARPYRSTAGEDRGMSASEQTV